MSNSKNSKISTSTGDSRKRSRFPWIKRYLEQLTPFSLVGVDTSYHLSPGRPTEVNRGKCPLVVPRRRWSFVGSCPTTIDDCS